MKRLLVMLCVGAMLVTGCGSGGSKTSEPTEKPLQGNKYVEQDFYSVPDELLDEDEIQVTDLQTNAEGEPALYQYAVGSDDEDDTGCSIYEYTLNSAGDWQTKQYGRKALTKLVKKTMEGPVDSVDLPYVSRGDDGNLYALMQVKLYDENANPFEKQSGASEYYLLAIDENSNAVQKTKLQTKVEENGSETDYAKEYDVTEFHVTEDGTPMLVFNSSSAMWFDSVSGTRTNLCESVSDGAFSKRVGYGENEIVYYSMSKKKWIHRLYRVLPNLETISRKIIKNMSGILTAIQRTGRCMLLICQDFIGLVILDKKHLPPVSAQMAILTVWQMM